MNSSPLLKFCFLSLCFHVALAVHVITDGLLDASQSSATVDIYTISINENKAVAAKLALVNSAQKRISKTVETESFNKLAVADSSESGKESLAALSEVASEVTSEMPIPADGGKVTEGLRPLNLLEVNKSIKRTQQAIEQNIEGQIKLKLLVDKTGIVRQVIAMNTLGYGLDQVAVEAAWKLRFIAAKIKSQNVALETFYTVKFTITHQ